MKTRKPVTLALSLLLTSGAFLASAKAEDERRRQVPPKEEREQAREHREHDEHERKREHAHRHERHEHERHHAKHVKREFLQAAERKLRAAVEAGKLSEEEARRKLRAIHEHARKEEGREHAHREEYGHHAREEERRHQAREREEHAKREKLRSVERELRAAVEAGKLSQEHAERKLGEVRRNLFGGDRELVDAEHARRERIHAATRKIHEALRAGELSKEQAHHKIRSLHEHARREGERERHEHEGAHRHEHERHHAEREQREKHEKFHAVEREIHAAVRAGRLSKREAHHKLSELKRRLFEDGEEGRRGGGHHREPSKKELYEAVSKGLKAAVKLGKLTEKEAREIWEEYNLDR